MDQVKFVVRCAIWYHLYNLKNVKNTHGGVLILKLQASATSGCSNFNLWKAVFKNSEMIQSA